jgi:ketosteroid isomerase-like protein
MELRRIRLALVLAAVPAAACERTLDAARELSAADSTALSAIAERDAAMVLARDFAAMSAGYTADAVRMPPNAPALVGRAAILASLEQMPPITAFAFRLLALRGDGEIAYMRAAWSYTLSPPGAAQVTDSGKILIVLRKQADGSWLRVADAWNSDLVPAQ